MHPLGNMRTPTKLSSYAYSVNPDGNGEYDPPNGGK